MGEGATLVDTRDASVRARDGWIPGSVHVPLSVLEWRVDPTSGHQSAALAGREERLILNTTDVIGGFVAWARAGLPVDLSQPSFDV
jgi:rhodanese-related sulfurtransferase